VTGYFRSLARRASGQGGWIRPVQAPVVVPEAAPLVETAEEIIAPGYLVERPRPPAVDRDRPQLEATEETRPVAEPTSPMPARELARSLRARRLEPASEQVAAAPLPPPSRGPSERRTPSQAPARQAIAARAPDIAETEPGPLEQLLNRPASELEPPLPAAAPVAPAIAPSLIDESPRTIEPSIDRAPIAARERVAAAPRSPAAASVGAPTFSDRPAALASPEPISIPAPRSNGQVVKVTIGRVEVRAPAPPVPPTPRPAPRPVPMMSLSDYLRERDGRR